jgi:Fur family ferric uptake transcriptional regulator
MPVPPYDQLISPLRLVRAAHDAPVQLAGLRPLVAQRLGLQPADLEELLPSGQQAVFDNRLGWAHDRLKRAGCSLSARRGWWQLTAEGRALAAAHPAGLPEAEVRRLAEPPDGSRLRPVEGAAPSLAPPLVGVPPAGPALPPGEQPLQRIRSAEAELRRDLARDLLGRVREVAPGRFERMVLDLLWAERSHLSARDIFEKLNDLGRNIGHTSVYQNLEALQSAGVIECIDRASGRLYGYRADPHSHLTCVESGSITDLDVELPDDLLRQIEAATGFAIESYTLHLSGRRRP